MPASSELSLWRRRLQAEHRIRIDKGIIGNTARSGQRILMEFYRANGWINFDSYQRLTAWRGLGEDELRHINKIFPYANQQQSAIAHQNPRVQYRARNEESAGKVPAITALHNYDIHEQLHIRQFAASFRDHQFCPYGAVRHGYTPEDEIDVAKGRNGKTRRIEFYRPANKNRPWIKRVAPWNVLCNSDCESFHMDGGMRWVAFRDVMSLDDIKRNPNMVARDKLGDVAGHISPEYMAMRDQALKDTDDPDANTWLEVWTVYEMAERTWFQMTLDDGVEQYLRKPADWPIPWEWLPVSFFSVNEQIDTPYSLSLLEDLIPLQIELDQVRTMLHQQVLRARRVNFVSSTAFEEDDLERIANADMNEWFKAKGGDIRQAVHSIQTGSVDPGALQHLAVIASDMRESLGISKMGLGERINVEAATEAAFVQQGQDSAAARIEDHFRQFVEEAETLYMQGRRAILAKVGASEAVRILGPQSGELEGFATVDAEDLAGLYEFEVVPGSMRRRDLEAEARQALADYQIAATSPDFFNVAYYARRYVQARGHSPEEAMPAEAIEASRIAAETRTAQNFAAGQLGTETSAAQPPLDPALVELLSGTGGMQ